MTADVPKQLKAIEAFEAQAVLNAIATKDKVDAELADLEATLKNIEEARPFEDLTVVRITLGIGWWDGEMAGGIWGIRGFRRGDSLWSPVFDIT